MLKQFETLVSGHQAAIKDTFSAEGIEALQQVSRELMKCLKGGHKILLCGNGGSAADAQHIAAEFVGRFQRERQSLPSIALTTDTSILTAVANDYDYSRIFSRQVEGLGQKGDVLIGISTSGNSANVLEAVEAAKVKEIVTIGFTGAAGGKLKAAADFCFQAQATKTSHIQEVHITALHAVSEVVEDTLFA